MRIKPLSTAPGLLTGVQEYAMTTAGSLRQPLHKQQPPQPKIQVAKKLLLLVSIIIELYSDQFLRNIQIVWHSILVILYLESSVANLTSIVSHQASEIQELNECKYKNPLNKYRNIPECLKCISWNVI